MIMKKRAVSDMKDFVRILKESYGKENLSNATIVQPPKDVRCEVCLQSADKEWCISYPIPYKEDGLRRTVVGKSEEYWMSPMRRRMAIRFVHIVCMLANDVNPDKLTKKKWEGLYDAAMRRKLLMGV